MENVQVFENQKKPRKQLTEEKKQKLREQLKIAREKKIQKKLNNTGENKTVKIEAFEEPKKAKEVKEVKEDKNDRLTMLIEKLISKEEKKEQDYLIEKRAKELLVEQYLVQQMKNAEKLKSVLPITPLAKVEQPKPIEQPKPVEQPKPIEPVNHVATHIKPQYQRFKFDRKIL